MKCPAPGEQDASWFPGDVVDCAGPCITKIVPTGEAAPAGDGGAVSKLAMQDECGDIVAQGGGVSSVCPVKFTGRFHMPPGMQEADDIFFATDAFSSSFNERIKLWVDDKLLIDQWSSLSSTWPTSAAQRLDADVPYKVVVEYTTTDYDSKKLDLHITTAGGVHEMMSLIDLPLQPPVMGASRTPVKVETSCYGGPPQEGAFSLVLAADPSHGLAWGSKHEMDDEWGNLYSYSVVTVPASFAGGFKFVGNKVAYLDDEFLGIEYNCGILKGGISSILLRSSYCTEAGTCGRDFVANADGSVSPVADMSLVLGWGPVTESCGGTQSGDEDGFILVDAGSPNRVVMSSYSPPPPPLLCLSDEANGTSLYVDHAEGYSWQCCRGDDCLAKFTALQQLDIYPSEEVCQSKAVRECTDPVVSAYKCQHSGASSSQLAVTGFELIDTGKPDYVLTDTLPGLDQTQPGLEGALAYLWQFVVLVYIVQ